MMVASDDVTSSMAIPDNNTKCISVLFRNVVYRLPSGDNYGQIETKRWVFTAAKNHCLLKIPFLVLQICLKSHLHITNVFFL